jgi:hypothetical protein
MNNEQTLQQAMKRMTRDEFCAVCVDRFGPDTKQWQFVCPMCGTVQSVQQYYDAGLDEEHVQRVVGFSCIGRFTGQRDEGIAAKSRGETWRMGCNWTLGGLFKVHKLEVEGRPCFDIALPLPEENLA